MLDNDSLDQAIDDEARVLTTGEPGPHVRARVSEQIAASRWSVVGGRWLVAGAAAAAVVVVVAIWPQRERPVSPVSQQPVAIVSQPPLPPPTGQASPSRRFGEAGAVRPMPDAVTSGLVPSAPIAVSAAAAIEPIELEVIEPIPAVELPMIVVEMIEIDSMEMPQ